MGHARLHGRRDEAESTGTEVLLVWLLGVLSFGALGVTMAATMRPCSAGAEPLSPVFSMLQGTTALFGAAGACRALAHGRLGAAMAMMALALFGSAGWLAAVVTS